VCNDRAIAVYGLIDPKFCPQIVYLTGGPQGHTIPVFQQNGKFGSLSTSVQEKFCRRNAEYDALVDLLKSYP
jgi:hypothetical protein